MRSRLTLSCWQRSASDESWSLQGFCQTEDFSQLLCSDGRSHRSICLLQRCAPLRQTERWPTSESSARVWALERLKKKNHRLPFFLTFLFTADKGEEPPGDAWTCHSPETGCRNSPSEKSSGLLAWSSSTGTLMSWKSSLLSVKLSHSRHRVLRTSWPWNSRSIRPRLPEANKNTWLSCERCFGLIS